MQPLTAFLTGALTSLAGGAGCCVLALWRRRAQDRSPERLRQIELHEEADRALKQSEEKFAKAFHGSPALMALIRLDALTVFDVNQAFLDVLGYTRDEAIDRRPTELNLFADLAQRDFLVGAIAKRQQVRDLEIQLRTRYGQIRDGLVSTETLSLSRESLLLAVVVDITERKRTEAALRSTAAELERRNSELAVARDAALDAARAKSNFRANMSHEIRTPLNGLLGMAELLSRSSLSPEQLDYVGSITRCGDLLLSILNNILDYSKIEAGRLQLESIPFDLRALVFDVVEVYGSKARLGDVELIVDVDATLPASLVGDPARLRQVLGNLVNNAVKFTARGHVLVQAKPLGRHDGGVALEIMVRDTGEGIPDEAQPHLFQPFTQADASTSRRHGGTGLGLALSKRIVEGMGGRLDLQSGSGKGATLTLTLSLPVAQERAAQATELAGRRMLLVDDNALARAALAGQLRALGSEVRAAASAEETLTEVAAALAAERAFDLILIASRMSGLGGQRLARVLRSDARLAAAGIVMLTPPPARGVAGAEGQGEDREEGCDGILIKPSRDEVIARVLGDVVRAKHAGHEPGLAAGERPVPTERGLKPRPARPPAATAGSVAPPSSPAQPGLDRARFREMAQLLASSASDSHTMLLQAFASSTEKRIEELARALGSRDGEAAYGVAHAIKGASANLGFTGLERLAGQIERLARAGELDQLSGEMLAMQEEMGRVRTFLRRYAEPGPPPA